MPQQKATQNVKNGSPTLDLVQLLDLVELKDMSIHKLNQAAKDMGVQGASGLRRQTDFQDPANSGRKKRAHLA